MEKLDFSIICLIGIHKNKGKVDPQKYTEQERVGMGSLKTTAYFAQDSGSVKKESI